MTEERLGMIEKVSQLYRDNLEKTNIMKSELKETELKLKRSISHKKHTRLERKLRLLQGDYEAQLHTTLGIGLARELLFD